MEPQAALFRLWWNGAAVRMSRLSKALDLQTSCSSYYPLKLPAAQIIFKIIYGKLRVAFAGGVNRFMA